MNQYQDESIFVWQPPSMLSGGFPLLARDPTWFRKSVNIECMPNNPRAPFRMTNKGVEIAVPRNAKRSVRNSVHLWCRDSSSNNKGVPVLVVNEYDDNVGLRRNNRIVFFKDSDMEGLRKSIQEAPIMYM